jgi:hypothetical protein
MVKVLSEIIREFETQEEQESEMVKVLSEIIREFETHEEQESELVKVLSEIIREFETHEEQESELPGITPCGHSLTYLLTPWSRVLLEKLTGCS